MSSNNNHSGNMRAVLLKKPGGPEQLYIGEIKRPTLRDGEVLLRVHGTALNRADTLQRQGKYPLPPGVSEIIGLEAAGEIADSNNSSKWKNGDRVMALLTGGGYAEYVAVPDACLMPIPEHMSYGDAGAIPEAWLTAYQVSRFIGQLERDEVILIHAGASGVGTAAIQIAKLRGAHVIVTAGSDDKLEFCRSLGADFAVNYKSCKFSDEVKKWLKEHDRKGVDVVIDPVGGSHWEDNFELLGLDSRYVVYGTMGGGAVKLDLMQLMLRRIMVTGTMLRARTVKYKGALIDAFTKEVLPALNDGKVKPIIWKTLDISEVAKAHELMESNANTGKIAMKL